MAAILIAEDEHRVSSVVRKGLSANGFDVTVVADGWSAFAHARSGDFDLLVLDIGLPRMDSFEVLRRLRAEGNAIPVVVLTPRADVACTVALLDRRSDEYIAKPFRVDELLARVRQRLAPRRPAAPPAVLSYGGLRLDLRARRAHVGDYTVDLSARETALAEMFLRHPGQVLTREQLLRRVWGREPDPGSNVVDVYVRYLRRKLGAGRFATVRGIGYRLEAGR
ncbi:response regulator with CheY-like receiver domain and winged-helix DNA-binding domain [Mycolicibacterium chubuense NBB4]|uniref:Response regulator with CheY-like receiver domain and winged-helix DNA-binding domain n=1 Tax=Mycolicibacterium chubuense (strain NBB4) TaxID=710421 RepID=I4BHW3_MYCCN|nr:response regulator transcription factor [Mycolicibacterium chubuense]AFM16870.1 response regulator with CheY-like receiver domain and winged-helix DNA-binding domain [Mycolicibacterium chubuense NBB4]